MTIVQSDYRAHSKLFSDNLPRNSATVSQACRIVGDNHEQSYENRRSFQLYWALQIADLSRNKGHTARRAEMMRFPDSRTSRRMQEKRSDPRAAAACPLVAGRSGVARLAARATGSPADHEPWRAGRASPAPVHLGLPLRQRLRRRRTESMARDMRSGECGAVMSGGF